MGELRAAVYARAASDHVPVADQLAALRVQVAADELRVPTEREFVDNGCSGATLARPGLERLRHLVTDGGIDRLYVHSPDRLAREWTYRRSMPPSVTKWRHRPSVRPLS